MIRFEVKAMPEVAGDLARKTVAAGGPTGPDVLTQSMHTHCLREDVSSSNVGDMPLAGHGPACLASEPIADTLPQKARRKAKRSQP